MKCDMTRKPIEAIAGNKSLEVEFGVWSSMVRAIVYRREEAIVTVAEK